MSLLPLRLPSLPTVLGLAGVTDLLPGHSFAAPPRKAVRMRPHSRPLPCPHRRSPSTCGMASQAPSGAPTEPMTLLMR